MNISKNIKLSNIKPTKLSQDNKIEFTIPYKLCLSKQTYDLEIITQYIITNETITLVVKDKYLNIEYRKIIELKDVFNYNIYFYNNNSLNCNKDIYSYRMSLYFLYLMIKNSTANPGIIITFIPYQINQIDYVYPKLNDQELIKILENKSYIERSSNLLSTDFILCYISYKKYKFIFCLNKYN
jgi:hypothetical protein